MTEKKYRPGQRADKYNMGIPVDRDLTADELNALPTSALLNFAFSTEANDARRERERQAAMQQQQPAPRAFTPEQIARMPLSDLLTLRDTHQGGQG